MNTKLFFAVCVAAIVGHLQAVTYYVAPPPAGSDGKDGSGWGAPMATISNAIAQTDVTLVLVSNGIYNIEATITNAKAAVIRGVNTPGETNTIIDGGGVRRCFILNHANAMLDGLVITNGYDVSGCGVMISSGGGIVTNCLITGNRCGGSASPDGGAGVWMYGAGAVYNSRIIGNRIVTNGSSYPCGGGVFMYPGLMGGLLENCLIAENICTNSTTYGGGGVFIRDIGTVRNCVISGNLAGRGGGVTLSGGGMLTNCLVAGNISFSEGGGVCQRDAGTPGSLVTDCVISNNRTDGTGSGGGVYMFAQATQIVRNCVITHNSSTNRDGGGIAVLAGAGGALIDGCTIEYNLSGTGNQGGGGVYVTRSGADPDAVRIINSTIRHNQAAKHGGGLVLYRGGVVSNCVIAHNIGSTNGNYCGGGVYGFQGGVITHSRIISNTCWYRGGGVYGNEGGVLINCEVVGNIASNVGGGLYAMKMISSNGSVWSCTFTDNESPTGGGIYVADANYFGNTIVWSNLADTAENSDVAIHPSYLAAGMESFHYCCASRDLSSVSQHNITNAPDFVDFAAGDYRLAAGSAGINAGTNEGWMAQGVDLDGRPRLDRFSRLPDMGCYEHIPPGMMFRLR